MPLTHWPVQSNDLPAALMALGVYETPLNGCIRAVFTRQPQGAWKYYIGQCILAGGVGPDEAAVYSNFAFASVGIEQRTAKSLLDDLTTTGIRMPHDLPPILLPPGPLHWQEDIIPTHANASQWPFRRFTASIESSAFMPDGQLVDFELPYRPSAAAYIKEFMSFKAFHGDNDGRRGQFTVEILDRRGAIKFAGGLLSISKPTVSLRMTGHVDGTTVDLRNDGVFEYDDTVPHDLDLWLLAEDSTPVDFRSTSDFQYRYEPPTPERERARKQEERYRDLIGRGESEACEFKPHVEIHGSKAFEFEKTVCAFSNQKGGTLFIGVSKDGDVVGLARGLSKRPEGLEKGYAAYEAEVRTRLREFLRDNQCFDLSTVSIMGTRLIVVEVRPASDLNYVTQGESAETAFIRRGATSFKMSPPEIQARGGPQLRNNQDVQTILREGLRL